MAGPLGVDAAAEFTATVLHPVAACLEDAEIVDFVETLGWRLPNATVGLRALSGSAALVIGALADLQGARRTGTDDEVLQAVAAVGAALAAFIAALELLPNSFANELAGFPALADITQNFVKRLLDRLIVDAIGRASQLTRAILFAIGVIEETQQDEIVGDPNPANNRPAFLLKEIRFGRLSKLVGNPTGLLEEVYGWGTPALNRERLFLVLREIAHAFAVGPDLRYASPQFLSGMFPGTPPPPDEAQEMLSVQLLGLGFPPLAIAAVPALKASAAELQGLALFIVGTPATTITETLSMDTTLTLNADLGLDLGVGVLLRPKQAPTIVQNIAGGGLPTPNAKVGIKLLKAGDEGPTKLFVFGGGSELTAESLFAELQLQIPPPDLAIRAGVTGGKLRVSLEDADGFIGKAMGDRALEINFDLAIAWSSARGLSLSGSAGIETQLDINKTIGPVSLKSVKLAARASAEGIRASGGLNAGVTIGPIAASVEGIGVKADVAFKSGNLGPLDLGASFLPPTGIGIVVNGGPVSGGGFLSFEDGRYSGALALSVYAISVKAFGIIETKFPDGHKGFSFIIIISAEFTPIQLGFGFTLNGVGGILGINRDLNEEALRNVVMRGSMGNVLFPKDPIKDAPSILHDIAELFPPADGHFAFGPMAILAWGTPAIIEARLGIVIVFPGPRIALLGTVQVLLPPGTGAAAPEKRLVEIHLDIAGLLDFPKKHFALDAKLHNSNVVGFPISGEMAARIDWGQNQNLLIAMGGFHPHFKPPAGFPKLRRMAIDLGISGNPSATLSGYMALTSNTAQVGAALDVRATGGGASLRGGLAFDALIVFSPFSFEASLEGGVHVDFHGAGFGMHFHGHISGPAPWHLKGDVCVSILWWDACVGFSVTLGGEHKPELPAIDVWAGSLPDAAGIQEVPGLERAIAAPGNWAGVLPPNGYQAVSIRQTDSSGASRVDPLGVATFQQKVLPFKLAISKFAGRDRPKNDPVTVTVKKVLVDGDDLVAANRVKDVNDAFAPAQYQKLPDAQALSSPSFQPMQAGFSVSSADLTNGTQKTKTIVFQTFVVGNPDPADEFPVSDDMLLAMVDRGASAQGGLRTGNIDRFVDFAKPVPALADETYALASKTTLKRFTTAADDAAYALTADKLAALPQDVRATLQIVPIHELAAA